jgi:sporulation-control protein spo0M
LGKTHSSTRFTLEKDIYYVGETIRVKVDCNNLQCKKDISGFKLKLVRNMQATSLAGAVGEQAKNANHQKYINVFKDSESVSKYEHKELELEITIPEIDDYHPL